MNNAIMILPLALLLGAQDAPTRSPFYTMPDIRLEPRDRAFPATPLGSPGSWVNGDDYPAAALSAHVTGTTGFRLDIDKSGAVRGCTVTLSSGSELLDNTACELLQRRAQFTPARDRSGRKVAGSYANRFVWALPDKPAPFDDWIVEAQVGFDAAGVIDACSTASQGPASLAVNPCSQLAELPLEQRRKLLGDTRSPVVIQMVEEHRVEGVPTRIAPAPRTGTGVAVFRRRIAFTVDARGEVTDCKVVEQTGEDLLHYVQYQCHPGLRYRNAGQGGKVTESFSITRRSGPFTEPPATVPADGVTA